MVNFQSNLEKYAELAVHVGVNIQPGQNLLISAHLHDAPFVRAITKKAYMAGAKHVFIDWQDEDITLLKYKLAPEEAFDEYPEWLVFAREKLVEQGAAFISIVSTNPDYLKDVDSKRISAYRKTSGKALQRFRQATQSDKVSWTVIGAASQGWADKVFPEVEEHKRVQHLWEAIFKACRIDEKNPVEAWKKHDEKLHKIVNYLNEKRYKKLHYTAPGTDLYVGLPENHVWIGGSSRNEKGHSFMANMPTEEVFSAPDRNAVEGYVKSTKPLSLSGNIIENFTLTFKDGRIVDVKAEKGEELLRNLIETDEGSHYLGEVALVPDSSPISQSNLLFYNTLFDENASCHFAIGSAYPICVEGGQTASQEELLKLGINTSIVHVDFMVGSNQLDIEGITADGKREAILRNGNWAFTL